MPSTVLVNDHGDVGLWAVATVSVSSSGERLVRAGKPAPAGLAVRPGESISVAPGAETQGLSARMRSPFTTTHNSSCNALPWNIRAGLWTKVVLGRAAGAGANGARAEKSSSRALKRWSHMK